MKPIMLDSDREPVSTTNELAAVITNATNSQMEEVSIQGRDERAEFRLATDALNYHRVEWRLREEWGDVDPGLLEKIKAKIASKRGYDPEELDAALIATRTRPRLPYGWNTMDLAVRRLETKPIRLLNEDLEASRYAKGILSLAIHLQELQKEQPILLPVEQVREILAAKKVVIAGTITKLVEMGLLEMTKATYNTGSAREFLCKGVEGKDYVFVQKKNGR